MSTGVFLRPGSLFHEPADFVPDPARRFRFDLAPLPAGWMRRPAGRTPWSAVSSPDPLPAAGWKVHVAARLEDADETLDTVGELCLELGLSFKYMPSADILHLMERKYAPRTSSGKFITVYAGAADAADRLLERLDPLLAGREAAVALTDVPVAGRPYGVRHGSFVEHWTGLPNGLDALAYEAADGTLHRDRRTAGAELPDGVAAPVRAVEALEAHRRARAEQVLPYRITRALHRSNGGGVYDALTPEDRRVVVKEGRRHTGLGLDGRDAADSLADEARALRALAGIPGIPEHVAEHDLGDRTYLVMEHLDGARGIEFVARHHPDMVAGADAERWRSYAERAGRIVANLRAAVAAMHRRGWSFGDLHPGNVLIRDDDSVALIDFETASDDPSAAGDRFTVAPGFRLPPMDARAGDLRRIDLIHLWLLDPDSAFWEFSDQVLAHRVEGVRHLLPAAARDRLRQAAREGFADARWGAVRPVDDEDDLPGLLTEARRTLVAAVGAWGRGTGHAPVDGGAGAAWALGGGMAGILWSLERVRDSHVEVALDRLADEVARSPRVLPGLFSGRAGVAQVLGAHGRHEAAGAVLDRALGEARHVTAPGLESGLSGVAWAALSAGRVDQAVEIAGRARRALKEGASGRGLFDGPSGFALLAVRLAEITGAEHWLDAAREALERDLVHLVHRRDGTVLLDRGNLKHQPDLAGGSLGVALAAGRLSTVRPDPALEQVLAAAGRTCLDGSWATQGLFRGRLGAIAFLAERGRDRTAEEEGLLRGGLGRLRHYLVRREGELLMPGRLQLRFSHSFGDGLAGAVRVLESLSDPTLPLLPGLDARTTRPRSAAGDSETTPDTEHHTQKETTS